jgi:type I restriction enzyme, S subunit
VHLVQNEKAIGSGEFYVAVPNKEIVDPEFLLRYLLSDLTLTQTKWIMTGNSYPRLTEHEFLNLVVILPDVKSYTQQKIVKSCCELENEAIKNSVDAAHIRKQAYLSLPESLSIEIPNEQHYEFYAMPQSELDDRLDFNYNLPHYRELEKNIERSKDTCYLGQLADPIRGFVNGIEIREFTDEEGTAYLRVGDLTGNDDIPKIEQIVKVKNKISDIGKDIKLEKGNILISRSGTMGIVRLIDDDFPKNIIISADLIRVTLKQNLNGQSILPGYISYFLKSPIGQMQFSKIVHGSSIPKVNHKLLSGIKVVLPEEDAQRDIEYKTKAQLERANEYNIMSDRMFSEARQKFVELLLQ